MAHSMLPLFKAKSLLHVVSEKLANDSSQGELANSVKLFLSIPQLLLIELVNGYKTG